MGNVGWIEIFKAGWPVLSILTITSVIMVAVSLERWRLFSQIKKGSEQFLDSIRKNNNPAKIIQWCDQSDQPLAEIAGNLYKASSDRETKDRILQRTIQSLVKKYESNISTLGTIASVAPFIGLLGTVIGIIRAFRAISMTQGGASAVAVGIAEALVGTAAGLVVAIPALLAYNYFVNRLRMMTQDWEIMGGEIIDLSISAQGGSR